MSSTIRKTYLEQSIHFLDRPHDSVARAPIVSKAAWNSGILKTDPTWRVTLAEGQVAEIKAAVRAVRALGKGLEEVLPEDFPLPTLDESIAAWADEIRSGRGFQVIKGVPIADWTREDAEWFFWCFGLHMGVPGAQNAKGDLLGHVTDTGAQKIDEHVRKYQTSSDIMYHCDGADAVGLLCWRTAKSGGASRLVSSVSIYNEILRREPDLVDALYDPFPLDGRNESKDGVQWVPIVPCRHSDGVLRTFYHGDYFRSVVRHADAPPRTDAQQRLLDLYEEIGNSPAFYIDMDLEPGDIQLVSNHFVLHARTEYEDYEDPAEKRHLLRLWLSL